MSESPDQPGTPIPIGLQTLLRLASVDPAFCDQVVRRRAEAADVAGVALTSSERAVLAALPADQLRQMAEQMPPPPPPRKAFLRQTAATAVVLLGGAAMVGAIGACCGEDTPEEVRPDRRDMVEAGGAAPDWPPDEPQTPEEQPAPGDDDLLEETTDRPDVRGMGVGGGAAPDMPRKKE